MLISLAFKGSPLRNQVGNAAAWTFRFRFETIL